MITRDNLTTEDLRRCMKYADEILELVDQVDNLTTSDLQGAVDAIVHKIMRDTKAIYQSR